MGVGIKVESWLISGGYDVKTVRNLDPRLPDQTILQIAVDESRIVITMDKDFGEMVYSSSLAHAGVLLLRLEAATGEEKTRIVAEIITRHADKLEDKFSVYQAGRLRIR